MQTYHIIDFNVYLSEDKPFVIKELYSNILEYLNIFVNIT